MSDYKKIREEILKTLKENEAKMPPKPKTKIEPKFDSMYAFENDEATVLYVIAMAVASIFNGRFILWVVFTIIWQCYIHRHDWKK